MNRLQLEDRQQRVERLAQLIKGNMWPDNERIGELVKKFHGLCDEGKDFITMEKIREYYEKDIDQDPRYEKTPEATVKAMKEGKIRQVEKRDLNGEGKVSRSEFIKAEFRNRKLDGSLSGKGDGFDGKLSKEEVKKYLREWTVTDADVDAFYESFKSSANDDSSSDPLTEDVIDGLFNILCPPDAELVEMVADKIRDIFTLTSFERSVFTSKFRDLCDGKKGLTLDAVDKCLHDPIVTAGRLTKADRVAVRKGIMQAHETMKRTTAMDDDDSDLVTLDELIVFGSLGHLLTSLRGYDKDGNGMMDKNEIRMWIYQKLEFTNGTEAEDITDALIHKFLKEDSSVLNGPDLLEGLFTMAFPTQISRCYEVVQAVRKTFALTEQEMKDMETEFISQCKSGDEVADEVLFIKLDDFMSRFEEEKKKEFKPKKVPESGAYGNAVDSKVKALVQDQRYHMERLDRSGDGRITKTEFMFSKIYQNLSKSIYGADGINNMSDGEQPDFKLNPRELGTWLYNTLGFKKNTEDYVRAVMNGLRHDTDVDRTLDTVQFRTRLYTEAFPPDNILVHQVIKAMRTAFEYTDKDEKALAEGFKKLAGDKSYIAKEDMKDFVKESLSQKYPADKAALLLPKRLEGIDASDSNNDGQINMEEYMRGQIYENIFSTLHAHNTDGDLIMDQPELVKWLEETCHLHGDMYADAVIYSFISGGASEIEINDLLTKLFDMACPTLEMRIKETAKVVKKKFDNLKEIQDSRTKIDIGLKELTKWLKITCGAPFDSAENALAVWLTMGLKQSVDQEPNTRTPWAGMASFLHKL